MRMLIGTVAVLGWVVVAQAQEPEPSFEVASVKVIEGRVGGYGLLPSGQARFDGTSLRYILMTAFDVPPQIGELRMVWSPAAEPFRAFPIFEILAQAPAGTDVRTMRAMLRRLLRERFALKWHTETRPTAVYALTVKEPGKLGPGLAASEHNCRAYIASGGKRDAPDSPRVGDQSLCWGARIENGQRVAVSAGTMTDLIETFVMSGIGFEKPVIDATGLKGNFTWEVKASSEKGVVFGALERQLGLKLEERTAPWEVIVIDEVKMPTPN